ncbi:hypothetical protein M9H77_23439 [Catharanthus roseus]|uniref:Uncharacterized protein n=1 Tax=Catharanthus roseus TaxID=4058 RepID=A0ACC0AU12_CATRO|nr:hypothetical protein M9H77_23439 [Catharanthus roseus]
MKKKRKKSENNKNGSRRQKFNNLPHVVGLPIVVNKCRKRKGIGKTETYWIRGLALPRKGIGKTETYQIQGLALPSAVECARRKEIFLQGLVSRVAFILEIGITRIK